MKKRERGELAGGDFSSEKRGKSLGLLGGGL